MPEKKEDKKRFFEKQLVIFSLGKEEFGVDIDEVREIIKLEDITKIPNTEKYIDGMINLRGRIIVIIDLAKKLEIPSNNRNQDTRIIVIETNNNTIGMIVDGCNEVIRINTSQIESTPEIIKNKIKYDFLEGVCIIKERLIILLDLNKVMYNSETITSITELTKK